MGRQSSERRSNCSGETAKPVTQASISRGEEERLAVGMRLEGEDNMVQGIMVWGSLWFRFGDERGLRVGS